MTRFVLLFVGCVIASSIAIPLSSDLQSNSKSGYGSINDGSVGEFVNHMAKGIKLSKETLVKLKDFQDMINRLKSQIDYKIREITAEIGLVNAEHIEYSKRAINAYRNVRSIIRRERVSLIQLAHKTEKVTTDLIFYMEGWGPEYGEAEKKSYLLEQMTLLGKLIDESKDVLANAKEKYELASDKMDEIDGHLSDFRRALQRLTDESSSDYYTWAQKVRGGAYGAMSGVVIGTLIADFLGCFGACTAIVGGSTIAVTTAGVETKLAELKERLNTLEDTVANAKHDVKLIQRDTTKLQNFINQEITLLSKWQNSVTIVEAKMISVAGKLNMRLHRKSFTRALQGLHDIASKFSIRPTKFS